jgi:hypothetical protein
VVHDNAEAVQLLLRFGASLSHKSKHMGVEMTPLELAQQCKKSKVLPYLLPSAAPTVSSAAATMHHSDTVQSTAPTASSASAKPRGEMEDWTIEQVCSHFASLGADHTEVMSLRKEKIRGSVLVDLGENDLEKLGISMGVRKAHMRFVSGTVRPNIGKPDMDGASFLIPPSVGGNNNKSPNMHGASAILEPSVQAYRPNMGGASFLIPPSVGGNNISIPNMGGASFLIPPSVDLGRQNQGNNNNAPAGLSKLLSCFCSHVESANVRMVDAEALTQGAELLGRGGFGEVYAALLDGTMAVVKVLLQKATQSEIDALREETAVLARLRHPHVVHLLACSERPPAIVMERAEYGGMDRLLKAAKGNIPLSCQIEFMHQISAGMVYLHSNNILHRDLSEKERF